VWVGQEEYPNGGALHVATGHAATAGRGGASLPGVYRAGEGSGISRGDRGGHHGSVGRTPRRRSASARSPAAMMSAIGSHSEASTTGRR